MRKRNCDDIQEELVDYADGVLPAEQTRMVAGHLDECARCRETVTNLRQSLSLSQAIWSDNLEQAGILVAACALVFVSSNRYAAEETLTFEQIQEQIERTATAAQLLAATNLIAQCEGAESIVAKQYRYILDRYGDTPAAATLKANEPIMLKGIQND